MSKITIYLSLKDGQLEYRDSEKHMGRTITTEVNPGDKVIWTTDENSGISDLSGINIIGSSTFFSKGPCKKAPNKWIAKVSRKAKVEIEYQIFVEGELIMFKEQKEGDKELKASVQYARPKLSPRP